MMYLRIALTILLMAATWLVWSGLYKGLLLTLGAISCLGVAWMAHRMGFFRNELFGFRFFPRLPRYWAWLFWQIVLSNIDVVRAVLEPARHVRPRVVRVQQRPEDRMGQAILANSTTLTPGSLTLDVHDGEMLVHCLTDAGAASVSDGEMNRRVEALTAR